MANVKNATFMSRKFIGILAFLFFLVISIGLLWLATQSDNSVSVFLSYAAGLSMIFLPCTLPLAFVIVPLAVKEKSTSKALGISVAFGVGLATTLALYGVVTAFLGGYFGLDQFTRVMFVIAGSMALIFALSELELLHVPLPSFGHSKSTWIKEGYAKTFFLGMFLGNAGIGCPNPAFYVLLTYIASTGSVITGGWLGLVHGLGRATPLIFLVLLTLLGMRSIDWVGRASRNLHIWTGTSLTIAGAFILTYGLFGMAWWEDSIFHASWNKFIFNIAPNLAEAINHPVAEGILEGSFATGWWFLIIFILIPLIWYKFRHGVANIKFWVIALLLVTLGITASTGIIKAEHSHGVNVEDNHTHDNN